MKTGLLEMKGIVKTFPGVLANDHVDLTVEPGEIHALLGENGAGKSTLMNILYGLYEKDEGDIYLRGEKVNIRSPREAIAHGVGMVHQDFMLVKPFTVAENVALGLNLGERSPLLGLTTVRNKIKDLSAKYNLAIDPDARIEHLSVGAQQRAEIVKILVRDAQLVILDEPTAVLVPQEIEALMAILRSIVADGRSIVFITHKLNEVMQASDIVTVLRDGKVIQTINTKDTDAHKLAYMMVGREVIFQTQYQKKTKGEIVLSVRDLVASNEKGTKSLNCLSFEIHQGEILGIAGVDGNGQTELAEVLAGIRPADEGEIKLEGKDVSNCKTSERYALGLAYVPADRRDVGCIQTQSIENNLILGRLNEFSKSNLGLLNRRRIHEHAEMIVERYDVRTPNCSIQAGKLSGGNLQKLILGREMSRNPKLLVVEQPTRGLDVGAIEYVRTKILESRQNDAAVLLISSELDEILALCDRIAVLYKGQIMGILDSQEVDIQLVGLMMAGTRKEEALL